MRPMLRMVLLVPVAGAAGVVSVVLAKIWNGFVGFGGAVVVGIAAALILWLVESQASGSSPPTDPDAK